MLLLKLSSIEKDKQAEVELVQLFEKTRVAFLSARTDPKEYGSMWRKAVEEIRRVSGKTNVASKEIKNYIPKDLLDNEDSENPTSQMAEDIFEGIKMLRYKSDAIDDPLVTRFGEKNVIEALLDSPEDMVKFVHYAIRADNKTLPKKVFEIKDMSEDLLTNGLEGLDLEEEDIALYLIEHYGDGKDTKGVEQAVENALEMLKTLFFSNYDEEEWDELVDIEKSNKSDEEKSVSHFVIPNKPMYRIFTIKDIEELKGFTGDWIVQEKYNGVRVQLHKTDNNIKVFKHDGTEITDKCPTQVKELKEKKYGDCILDAELILFKGEDSLNRTKTLEYLEKKDSFDDTHILRCHVFDIMRHDNMNMMEREMRDRISTLFNNYSSHSSTEIAFPSKKDTREADNMKDLEEYSKSIFNLPTSEGVVIKDATSTYYLGTKKNPKWIKMKRFVDLDLLITSKKGNNCELSVLTNKYSEYNKMEKDGKHYMKVANFRVKEDVKEGDIVRVKLKSIKKTKDGFNLVIDEVIEIPEAETPDKDTTLEILEESEDAKIKYDLKELEKGIRITDHIHGEVDLLIKSSMDGFVIYPSEQNLMSKNAFADIDLWKKEAEQIFEDKKGKLYTVIFDFIKSKDKEVTSKEVHNFLKKKHNDIYMDIFGGQQRKIENYMRMADGINPTKPKGQPNQTFVDDPSKIMNIKKEYKTPEKYREGKFKIYKRKDENLNISIQVGDENLNWLVDIDDEEEMFDLFGKGKKFPAEVAKNIQREKVIDEGDITLGVQRHGYHEYIMRGNKFQSKLHFRVLPVKDEKMWLVWTGFKQKPLDSDEDDGVWNIYEDKSAGLRIPYESRDY